MIQLYLLLNLSLVVAYGLFRLGERLSPQMSFRTWLRWGQLLLVLSLAAPVLMKLLPQPTEAHSPLKIMAPLWEGAEGVAERFVKPALPSTQQATPETVAVSTQILEVISTHLKDLLLIGIFISLLIKARAALQVYWLLKGGIVIRRLGQVSLLTSARIQVPFSTLVGGRAWIAVPESLVSNWKDFKLAVKHELQHHRQKDTAWALAIEIFSALFFLNPFAQLWKRRINEIQELSCDEALIGRKVSSYEYGSCLVRVAETALENCNLLVGTTSMAAGFENPIHFKSFLKRRIDMLVQHKHRRPCRFVGLTIGTLTLLTTFACAFGAEQVLGSKPAIAAGEVITDPTIQKIADSALAAALKRHKASLGFIVVSDPQTGRVLAVANEDNVDPLKARTRHWALSLRVGPASISKAFVAAAAVDKGLTSFNEIHNCEMGKYQYGGKLFQDWKPFDKLSTAETVIHSSNICGIKVGQKLGMAGLTETLKNFGFGTGGSAENFPEARSGEIPPSKGDDPVYLATVSTGYGGIYLSPIEIVQAFGAIANGGNLLKPQNGKASAVVVRRVLSETTSKQMKEVLAEVMTKGTAMGSASKLYRLAGKTATGYSHTNIEHDTLGGEANMASFVGFGPVDNPRVVIYVGVENPTDGGGVHGSYHAAPVFREVAEKTLQYLKVATK